MAIIILNIQFQICGFIMVLMVMFFYFSNRTLKMTSERAFCFLLTAVTVCIFLDIASIVSINFKDILPKFIVDFACKSYTISICIVAFFTRIYVFINITHEKLSYKQKLYHFAPLAIGILLTALFPIYYHLGDGQIYTYGIVIYITYITVAFYLLSSTYYIIRWRKHMNTNHFYAIRFLLTAWIITAFIQFLKNEWLLVGFAMSAAMVYMYFCLENPSQNLDSKTGLFNHSAYYLYIQNLCYEKKDFILVVLSIDNMKFISETFGIYNADLFLQEIATYLNSNLKGKAFRDFDHRFSLVFTENMEEVPLFLNGILERIKHPFMIANSEYNITISIVEIQGSICNLVPEKVIEVSRYFVSKVSKIGKGNYLKITETQIAEKEEKNLVEKALLYALEHKTVQVYYQPIYSLKEKRYVSAEALARITDENGNFINPELFIRVAEQKGLILDLGKLIFEEVCSFICKHPLKQQGLEYIEINLSVVQCMQEKLADDLIEIMEKYNIHPNFINLEITETAATNSPSTLLLNMKKLIAAGVSFSLDDYGTGYSNLSYIIDLPVKLVKIDKSIVQAYHLTEKVRIAMESTILMIKKLNLSVVVEGIETEEQLKEMYPLEVDFIQGYYFSKPLNTIDFINEVKRIKEMQCTI